MHQRSIPFDYHSHPRRPRRRSVERPMESRWYAVGQLWQRPDSRHLGTQGRLRMVSLIGPSADDNLDQGEGGRRELLQLGAVASPQRPPRGGRRHRLVPRQQNACHWRLQEPISLGRKGQYGTSTRIAPSSHLPDWDATVVSVEYIAAHRHDQHDPMDARRIRIHRRFHGLPDHFLRTLPPLAP